MFAQRQQALLAARYDLADRPAGFLPLPHSHHEAGGMIFPKFLIEETKRQTDRDLTRFDLDFDLPDHFLPEFPPPIDLTTRRAKAPTFSNVAAKCISWRSFRRCSTFRRRRS